jgi:N-acetylmuramoyl-L-alanine amidase
VGFLDAPKTGEKVRGSARFVGWAADESGIKEVAIYIDRQFVGTATLGLSRPDLLKAYSSFPDVGSAGFEFMWDSSTVPPGMHRVTAQARANNGATYDVGTVLFDTVP